MEKIPLGGGDVREFRLRAPQFMPAIIKVERGEGQLPQYYVNPEKALKLLKDKQSIRATFWDIFSCNMSQIDITQHLENLESERRRGKGILPQDVIEEELGNMQQLIAISANISDFIDEAEQLGVTTKEDGMSYPCFDLLRRRVQNNLHAPIDSFQQEA